MFTASEDQRKRQFEHDRVCLLALLRFRPTDSYILHYPTIPQSCIHLLLVFAACFTTRFPYASLVSDISNVLLNSLPLRSLPYQKHCILTPAITTGTLFTVRIVHMLLLKSIYSEVFNIPKPYVVSASSDKILQV